MRARPAMAVFAVCTALLLAPPTLPQEPRTPGRYALLIGIDDYGFAQGDGSTVPKLSYPDDDVRELKSTLEQQGWKVVELTNDGATNDQILYRLMMFNRKLGHNDTLLVYFAGHGVRNDRGRTFWMTHNADPAQLDYLGIRLSHVLQVIADLPPRTKVVFLDHCYAGNVEINRDSAAGSGEPGSTLGDRPWSIRPPEAGKTREIFNPREHTEAGADRDRMVVVAAARGPAYEPDALKHGLFTYWLLQALRTADADKNKDWQLTLRELMDYLDVKMTEYSKKHKLDQSPLIPPAGDVFAQFSDLQLFMLPIERKRDTLEDRRQVYSAKLREWSRPDRAWISESTIATFSELLGRWVEKELKNAVMSPQEEMLIINMRAAIEGNLPSREQVRAETLEIQAAAMRSRTP